jgi:hypothetical protein
MKMFVEPLKKVITPMTGKRLMKISNQTWNHKNNIDNAIGRKSDKRR